MSAILGILLLCYRLFRPQLRPVWALGLIVAFSSYCPMLLIYGVEARPYALAWLVLTGILLLALRFLAGSLSPKWLALVALLNFVLPSLHYVVAVYSLCVLLGVVFLVARVRRRECLALAGAFMAGWGLFAVFALPTLYAQFANNRAGVISTSMHYVDVLTIYGDMFNFPIVLVVVGAVLGVAAHGGATTPSVGALALRSIIGVVPWVVFAGLFCLPPLAFFCLAKAGLISIWGERFFWGSVLGLLLASAALAAALQPTLVALAGRWRSLALPLVMMLCAVNLLLTARSLRATHIAAPVAAITRVLDERIKPEDGLIVVEELNTYFYLAHYSRYTNRLRLYVETEKQVRQIASFNRTLKIFDPMEEDQPCVVLVSSNLEKRWSEFQSRTRRYVEQRRVPIADFPFASALSFFSVGSRDSRSKR